MERNQLQQLICQKFLGLWLAYPELRFNQLVLSLSDYPNDTSKMFYTEDGWFNDMLTNASKNGFYRTISPVDIKDKQLESMLVDGLMIEDVIKKVIEMNGLIGVGLVSLQEEINNIMTRIRLDMNKNH
jgi:hypothetical protein